MSLFSNILNKVLGREKANSSLKVQRIGAMEVFTDINTQKAIDNGFLSNSAVYSIVMKDAEKFASITRYVMDAETMEEKSALDQNVKGAKGDLIKLLNRPNEFQSQDAFLTAVRAYFKICGEAFIWLNRGDVSQKIDEQTGELIDRSQEEYEQQPVVEMFVLPSNYVTIIPDDQDLWGVKGYVLEIGQRVPINKADVIHWKTPNLKFDATTRSHLRGLPPLTPGYKTLEQNNSATNSAVRMYQNDGAKGVLFNEQLELNPQQESQVREVVNGKINNNDVKGAVSAFQGKWGYLNLGGTSVDLQLLDGKKMSMMELCFLMQVPYTQFDPNTAFANSEWQQKNWITNTIIPHCKQLDGEFNRKLLKPFGLDGICFIASDFSELPEMQEDQLKLAQAAQIQWWKTGNEKRKMTGDEPVEDPLMNEIVIPSGMQLLSDLGGDGGDAIIAELNKRGLNDYGTAGTGNRA